MTSVRLTAIRMVKGPASRENGIMSVAKPAAWEDVLMISSTLSLGRDSKWLTWAAKEGF